MVQYRQNSQGRSEKGTGAGGETPQRSSWEEGLASSHSAHRELESGEKKEHRGPSQEAVVSRDLREETQTAQQRNPRGAAGQGCAVRVQAAPSTHLVWEGRGRSREVEGWGGCPSSQPGNESGAPGCGPERTARL